MIKNKKMRWALYLGMLGLIVSLVASSGILVQADNNDDKVKELTEGKGSFKFDEFPKHLEKELGQQEPTLNVNPQGRALITSGEVTSVSWPNLTVKVWGLSLSVTVPPNAKIIGGSNATSTSTTTPSQPRASVGDKVDILGEMNKTTGVISAKHFRNRSGAGVEVEGLRQQVNNLLKQLEDLRAKIKQLQQGF